MKRFTLILTLLAFVVAGFAQQGPSLTAGKHAAKAPKNNVPIKGTPAIGVKPVSYVASSKATLEDPSIIVTKYDMQTNSSVQNRLYLYSDGTIGATSQFSHTEGFSDRGTGYNYFDGSAWGAQPSARIESSKSGWPSYEPFGANGEIFSTHHMTAGLFVCKRDTKGTGAWTESILPGPSGATDISWPRLVTNGPDRTNIHILCATYVEYQGLENCLLYYRSTDGGQSWDINGMVFPQISSSEYLTIPADTYTWAEPKGDTLCFLVGDSWNDLFIMKSTDNGDTWVKTVIWPCPYNLWEGGDTTGTFWCPDGSSAIALDSQGKAHILAGLQRGSGDEGGNKYWVPYTDGVLYWNEDMPQWPDELDPDQLYADGNLIGWVLDTMVYYATNEQLPHYYASLTTHPSLAIDGNDNMYAVWSGVTTLLDPDNFLLRHIFGRGYDATADTWTDITDLTDDFLYSWSECVFPSVSPTTSLSDVPVLFQEDELGGINLLGSQGAQGQQVVTDNDMIFLNRDKGTYFGIYTGLEEDPGKPAFAVSQNNPNPADDHTSVVVNLTKGSSLGMTVTSVTGQTVWQSDKGFVQPGQHGFYIDCSSWTPGIYFYTVKAGTSRATKKMVVE